MEHAYEIDHTNVSIALRLDTEMSQQADREWNLNPGLFATRLYVVEYALGGWAPTLFPFRSPAQGLGAPYQFWSAILCSHLPGSVASLGEELTAQLLSVETVSLIGRKRDDIKAAVSGSPASMPWYSLVALGYHEASMTCHLTSSGDRTVHSLSTLGGRRPRFPARARDGFSSRL